MGFPGGSDGKECACNGGDLCSVPGLGKFPWRRAWQATPVFFPGEFPWTEEPGGLQSIGSQRVGHDWHKMWELDCEESWAQKNWCFWTVVLEKTPESPLDYKEIQPIHSKGDQSWVFIRRTDAEAETPVLWPPHAKSWLIGKDSDAGRDWGQEEKGTTEDKVVGMASPAQWTWVWVNSWSWWWTGRPGVMLSMWSHRVGHDWESELNWKRTCL